MCYCSLLYIFDLNSVYCVHGICTDYCYECETIIKDLTHKFHLDQLNDDALAVRTIGKKDKSLPSY